MTKTWSFWTYFDPDDPEWPQNDPTRYFQFYFCNQTRRLGENFRGIELSHSSTGLGSTNDLSWKSKN